MVFCHDAQGSNRKKKGNSSFLFILKLPACGRIRDTSKPIPHLPKYSYARTHARTNPEVYVYYSARAHHSYLSQSRWPASACGDSLDVTLIPLCAFRFTILLLLTGDMPAPRLPMAHTCFAELVSTLAWVVFWERCRVLSADDDNMLYCAFRSKLNLSQRTRQQSTMQ